MRKTRLIAAVLTLASMTYAKSPKAYRTGQILQMNSVPCSATRSNKSQLLCREYTLQSENVVYTIRPRDQKRGPSITIGDHAQFRLNRNMIVLRSEISKSKEHPFVVISVAPAAETST